MTTLAALSKKEKRAVLESIRAPALWSFQLLAGEIGFDRAVECCSSRIVPEEAEPAFQACAYQARDLPDPDDLAEIIKAVRVKLTWSPNKEALQTAARRVGLTLREAQAALKVYREYGSHLEFPACS